MQAIDVWNLG